jgi:hypothetical protein
MQQTAAVGSWLNILEKPIEKKLRVALKILWAWHRRHNILLSEKESGSPIYPQSS